MYYKYGGKTITAIDEHTLEIAIKEQLAGRLKNVIQTIAEDTIEEVVYNYPASDSYDRTGELKDALKVEEVDEETVQCTIDGSVFQSHPDNPRAHAQYFQAGIDELLHYLHHDNDYYDLVDSIRANIDTRFKKEFVYGGSKYD